ncbi:MAG TPA: hotdog family protein [Burkholderiaceae bacterium]|nr:hotdog family protein [Burkholderiaceae bacterium]
MKSRLHRAESMGRDWIAARIPHRGAMCLLHRVEDWDEQRIRCSAVSHRAPDNPLRAHGRLAAACGIEYAAQAMAVHGALIAPRDAPPRLGYLASVRGAVLHVGRLDDIAADLTVEATRFSGDGNTILYDFALRAAGRVLLEGRAAVILDAHAGSVNPSPLPNPLPEGEGENRARCNQDFIVPD